MYERSEAFFTGASQLELFYQIWKPENSKGNLIITHGQAEHSECYLSLVQALSELNLTIYAWDLQGHGRSEGKRGYAKNFNEYVKDFATFVKYLEREHSVKMANTVLLGHSMGGLIQCSALIQNLHWNFKAQVLSSPMFGISVDVPLIKDIAAMALRHLWPTLTLNNEINFADLSRDPRVIHEFEKDVMRHDKISSGVYLGSIEAMEIVRKNMNRIHLPTLMQIAEKDPVTDSAKSRLMFERMGSSDKVLKAYPDRKHEIYNDVGREEVYKDLIEFLKQHN
jgi:lysophospholipase